KVQRFRLSEDWVRGVFEASHGQRLHRGAQPPSPDHSSADLRDAIRRIWSDVLRRDAAVIGPDGRFVSLGGTSVKAIEMLARVEHEFAQEFGYALLLECRTVRDVAEFVARRSTALCQAQSALLPLPGVKSRGNDIAIVGVAGRFPAAATLDEFWANLRAGSSAVAPVPKQRWRSSRGRFYMGTLADIDMFAADFFGISGEEAVILDPQQRLMLEVAYEALENAGYTGSRLCNDLWPGVYTGVCHNSYFEEIVDRRRHDDFEASGHSQLMPANLLNMVAARVAHSLNLKGPALTFDTACSSSLVAIHQACNDLLLGECDLALAGGVNLLATPTAHE